MTEPRIIPRAILFGNPDRMSPALSPDGRRIAFIAPVRGVKNVLCGPVGGPYEPVTDDRGRGVHVFAWAHDGTTLLYAQDRDGDENTHLQAVDVTAPEPRDLTPYPGVQARLVALRPNRPGHALITLNRRDRASADAHLLDLRTGDTELVATRPGVTAWTADADLDPRAAVEARPEDGLAVVVRDADGSWRTLHAVDHDDTMLLRVVGFTAAGTHLLLLSSKGAPAARLLRVDVATGVAEVLAEDPRYDVIGAGVDPDGEARLAVIRRERADIEPLRPDTEADIEALRAGGPGEVTVLGEDDADRTWLVRYLVDDGPAIYRLYHRDTGRTTTLFSHTTALAGLPLAKVEPFTVTARDGLAVPGYLTFPPGRTRAGLPAVVVVHGGPWTRDLWGYRAETQWLANRGYVVVQVNFRGSTGYGKDFVNAGDRQWGAAMQHDLLDAVDHVVSAGWVDPARVAIYGGSYGGYAALVGVTATPEVFRCGVALAAPSDLRAFVATVPGGGLSGLTQRIWRRIGHPVDDAEMLLARSPLAAIDRLRVPLLVAHGANDPRVPVAEAERVVAVLRANGIDHEYLLFPDEGHAILRPRNRMVFHAAVERFLARHLGGGTEEPGEVTPVSRP
ncbi:S9 family peptidase [Actinokineospora inagensis]|uniref:S9 family peptidase n=1 Tax=Actinokineospora inagensis TaxID=103730 RepID=UPI000423DFE4|nr:S9 family peptidase [Actinokineospora inagensis]